jgi:dethiobiotin synthetase
MSSTPQSLFVTGTDTDVGKTFISCALLHRFRAESLRAVGYKPVAAGASLLQGQLCNEDALRLQAASSPGYSLAEINPVCLPDACSPHIAAARAGVVLELDQLVAGYQSLAAQADVVLVEGAGGFIVPLSETLDAAQLAQALALPVVLVVGLRLGCLNHALLSAEAIRARGLNLAGWVGNLVDPQMPFLDANIATLRSKLDAPCLGIVPRLSQPDQAAGLLTLP